ncbi:MAG: hypothetical protein JWO00_704 [Candidatus Parcubacteria bacterium]|nr:hypothetical protein [Candidatus Parcubacteria bacterium]
MKKTIIAIVVVLIIGFGIYFISKKTSNMPPVEQASTPTATTSQTNAQATGTPSQNLAEASIGTSVQGRPITAYHFGAGTTELLFVGGIHGGYEWNTVQVAQQLVDYLKANPSAIPANVRITVIPAVNPDGLYKVVGTTTGSFTQADVSASQATQIAGRFNANKVDLNRNFDCDWQASGTWQSTPVSGGSSAFSEPESKAMRAYVDANKPAAVVVWYSAAGGVYASSCRNGVSTETDTIMKTFAKASGYAAHASFDSYTTTGDMTNWLAKIGIPTISVLLTNHTDTEWSKNLAGVQALISYYSKY